jgi:hypothetical protein
MDLSVTGAFLDDSPDLVSERALDYLDRMRSYCDGSVLRLTTGTACGPLGVDRPSLSTTARRIIRPAATQEVGRLRRVMAPERQGAR